MSAEPGPTPTLDAAALVADFEVATGERLTIVGRASVGEVGAAFVRRGDGSECVLKRGGDADALRLAARAMEVAREAGVPVPRYLDVVPTDSGVAVLQERMPGRLPPQSTDEHVDQMIAVVDRLSGLLTDTPWLAVPDLYLEHSGPGFCVHASLERFDDRSRGLLGWVREVGRTYGSYAVDSDLVHPDLHLGNVLFDDSGVISGVVDWDAAGRGDARLGFVTMWFDLERGVAFDSKYAEFSPAVLARVADRIAQIPVDRRRMFWAHMALRQVDWALRHRQGRIEWVLNLALAGIARFNLT